MLATLKEPHGERETETEMRDRQRDRERVIHLSFLSISGHQTCSKAIYDVLSPSAN